MSIGEIWKSHFPRVLKRLAEPTQVVLHWGTFSKVGLPKQVGLTLNQVLELFAFGTEPFPLADHTELFPPLFCLNRLRASLEAFARLEDFDSQTFKKLARVTAEKSRPIPFMSQFIEKKSPSPIQVLFMGLEKCSKKWKKFLDTTVPEAIECTNMMFSIRDDVRSVR